MATKIEPQFEHRQATANDVRHFQYALAATLPRDYRQFLIQHNGGHPVPARFFKETESVDILYGLCQKHGCLNCQYFASRGIMPDSIIPIGRDGFGNKICLAISGKDKGSVYFQDHEQPLDQMKKTKGKLIAKSFAGFLKKLK